MLSQVIETLTFTSQPPTNSVPPAKIRDWHGGAASRRPVPSSGVRYLSRSPCNDAIDFRAKAPCILEVDFGAEHNVL